MTEKQTPDIPQLIFRRARRHFLGLEVERDLLVEFKLIDGPQTLFLFSRGMLFGPAEESVLPYGDRAGRFFEELRPRFSRVRVRFYRRRPVEFASYEEFLEKITETGSAPES